ncbi:MAG: hypothetical protein KY443_12085, partial [Actinobacteria bacterium]|nr:hypothetical protein [Actinomycetota bacterium]
MRWLEGACIGGALFVLAVAGLRAQTFPDPVALLLFGSLLIWAENAAVALPNARVSPSFMVVMASLAAFNGEGAVLGAGLVGLCGGLAVDFLRRRKFRVVAYNCAQYVIAAAAAAAVSEVVAGSSASKLVAYVAGGVVFAVVNVALVLPAAAADTGAKLRAVWADMAPTLPNYLAFGLLGILIGQLYERVGPISVVVLVTPLVVARSVFGAFQRLRQAYGRLEVLYGFTENVGGSLDVDEVVRTTLAQVRQSLRVEQVELALLEEDGTLIRCTIAPGANGAPVVTRVDEPVAEDAHALELSIVREAKTFSAGVATADPELQAVLAARGMRQVMGAPLTINGRIAGAL